MTLNVAHGLGERGDVTRDTGAVREDNCLIEFVEGVIDTKEP